MKNYNLSAEWLENTRKETFSRNYFLKDGNAYYCHSLTMLRVLQTSLSEKEKQSEHQPKLGDAVLTADEYYEILDIYATAYNAGRVMFREKYLIDKNVLYGINADSYIRQLDKNLNDIWIPESRNNSIVVSEAVIVKMGTAAGHWHELTDIYNDHKELFEKYEIKAIDEAPEAEAPEAEAPETPKRDLSKFDDLFVMTISKNHKEMFKKDINTFVDGYTKNQIVALALVLHDLVHQAVRPKVFKTWLEMFCAIIGKETPTAKQSKPEVQAEIPKMKQTYYYLFL